MLAFTLAISCLTTSSFPLIYGPNIPGSYAMLLTLLPSPFTSTTRCCFCFDPVSSFFLELFLRWSPVAYWAPNNLGSSSFSVLSLFLFVLFIRVLKARRLKWFAIPFSSGPHFVRTLHHDPSILGGPTWHGSLSFIELDKAVVHVIRLGSFLWLWFQSVFHKER